MWAFPTTWRVSTDKVQRLPRVIGLGVEAREVSDGRAGSDGETGWPLTPLTCETGRPRLPERTVRDLLCFRADTVRADARPVGVASFWGDLGAGTVGATDVDSARVAPFQVTFGGWLAVPGPSG